MTHCLCALFFQLEAPLFVTWFQCVVCLVCLFLLSFLGENYPQIDKFPAFTIDLKVARQVGRTTVARICHMVVQITVDCHPIQLWGKDD